MTEQQIENLKSLLEQTDSQANSEQLDDKILAAAAKQSESFRVKGNRSMWGRASMILPIGALGSASAAIALTTLILLSLSLLLSGSEVRPGNNQGTEIVINLGAGSRLNSKPIKANSVTPERPDSHLMAKQPDMPPFVFSPEIDIPSTDALLNGINYALPQNKDTAKRAIILAMMDIRSMVNDGKLDSARERYVELVQACHTCTLPASLDELIRTGLIRTGSG